MINFEHRVLLCEAQYTVLMFSIEKPSLCETQVLILISIKFIYLI